MLVKKSVIQYAYSNLRPDISNPLGQNVTGNVQFLYSQDITFIYYNISGLAPNSIHGIHIHAKSIPSDLNCTNAAGHFNPFNTTHGNILDDKDHRHVGDLGNIQADSNGTIIFNITDSIIKLDGGMTDVTNLGLVLHSNQDDLGKGGVPASLTTGNSGSRIACGNITRLYISGNIGISPSWFLITLMLILV